MTTTRLLTRYVLREFLRAFGFSLGLILLIQFLARLFDEFHFLLAHKPPLTIIALYYLNCFPDWVAKFLPVASLMAALFSLGGLSRRHELTAMKAGGVPLERTLVPLFLVGVGLAAVSFLITDRIVPVTDLRSQEIWRRGIRRLPETSILQRTQVILAGAEGRVYRIQLYQVDESRMEGVTVDRFDEAAQPVEQIVARRAQWNGAGWVFKDGVRRTFRREVVETPFHVLSIPLPEHPEDFARPLRDPEQYTIVELVDLIRQLRRAGRPAEVFAVEFHHRIAFPFSSLVVVLIASAFAAGNPRAGKMMAMTLGVLVVFLYWGLVTIGRAMGESRQLSPPVAGWMANGVFGGLGLFLFSKARR